LKLTFSGFQRVKKFRRSRRAVEVLTGNLLMIVVMASVFSSIAFLVKASTQRYSSQQQSQMVEQLSSYLSSKVSEAWGVSVDETPLSLPETIGGSSYIIESEPGGQYLIVRTVGGTFRIPSNGITLSRRSIRSTEPHTIGIRYGKVVIDPPPLTEVLFPLDGSVFGGPFNLSYRTSRSATEHEVYLDGRQVSSSTSSLDGMTIDPNTPPTNLSDGQHLLTVVTKNNFGYGQDSVKFVIDRTPPQVELNVSQIWDNKLKITVTDLKVQGNKVEMYVFITDDKNQPVRELDESDFYIYDSENEFLQGGRLRLQVLATDGESRVDPSSYGIYYENSGNVESVEGKEAEWDSKGYNGTTTFWARASDIAGNWNLSMNVTKSPTNRRVEVGPPDKKSDLSVIFTNDVSGSMDWVMWKDEYPKPGEPSRLDYMKAAVKSFIDKMFPEDEGAICSFATNYDTGQEEIILRHDFTLTTESGKTALKTAVDALTTRDGTPLYDALYQSVLWVKDRTKYRAVLVLTDGKDLNYATGQPYSNRTFEEVIELAKQEGVPIYCVGLGDSIWPPPRRGCRKRTTRLLASFSAGTRSPIMLASRSPGEIR